MIFLVSFQGFRKFRLILRLRDGLQVVTPGLHPESSPATMNARSGLWWWWWCDDDGENDGERDDDVNDENAPGHYERQVRMMMMCNDDDASDDGKDVANDDNQWWWKWWLNMMQMIRVMSMSESNAWNIIRNLNQDSWFRSHLYDNDASDDDGASDDGAHLIIWIRSHVFELAVEG